MKYVKCLVCKKKIKIPNWYNIIAWCVIRLYREPYTCGVSDLGSVDGRFVVCPCGGATCLLKDYERYKKMLKELEDVAE